MKALILVGTLGFAWAAADEKLADPEKDLVSQSDRWTLIRFIVFDVEKARSKIY